MLFDIANLTYWIFLLIGITFFLMIIISGGDDQDFGSDIDVDVDMDVDVDVDADADFEGSNQIPTELEVGSSDNTSNSVGEFFAWLGFGKTPVFILLAIDFSTWGVTGWALNVAIGTAVNGIPTGFLAILIFIVSFGVAVLVGKVLSKPIGQIFKEVGEDVLGERLVGRIGEVISPKVPYIKERRIAQADVMDSVGNLVTVSICLPDWAQIKPLRGERVLIIDHRQDLYLVIAKDTSDEDRWMKNFAGK